MAVVVQRMVPARAAGVAMTLNPSNGDRSKIAIEASFGLGESVVSGTVTPDHFLVDKVMLDVVSTTVGSKETELVADLAAGCVTELEVEEERRAQPALSGDEARRSRRWPSAPSSTTASRRTSSGRSTPRAASSCCRAGPRRSGPTRARAAEHVVQTGLG